MRIAILVTGEARLTEISARHVNSCLQSLKSQGIESDIFVHSWDTVTTGRTSNRKIDTDCVQPNAHNAALESLLLNAWQTSYVSVENQSELLSELIAKINATNSACMHDINEFENKHGDQGMHFPFFINNVKKTEKFARSFGQMISSGRAWTLLKDNSDYEYDLVYRVRHDGFHPGFEKAEFHSNVIDKFRTEFPAIGHSLLTDHIFTKQNKLWIADQRFASSYAAADRFYSDIETKILSLTEFKNSNADEYYSTFRSAGLIEHLWQEIATLSNVSMTSSVFNLVRISPFILPSLLLRPGIEYIGTENINESTVREVSQKWLDNQH